MLMCSASAEDEINLDTVYLSALGDDTAAGDSAALVTTLTQACALLSADGGTIYLTDEVSVTATLGDCFIEPVHTDKITITSAAGCDGGVDLTEVEHFHFAGEIE